MRTKIVFAIGLAIVMVLVLSSMPGTAYALSIPFRSDLGAFGPPLVFKDNIVFTHGHPYKLTCIDLSGKKIWEKQDQYFLICGQRDDNSLVVQMDRRIVAIDVPTGSETCLFQTASRGERVRFERDSGLVWSYNPWKDSRFRVLDSESGDILWKNSKVRHVICATQDMVICMTGKGAFSPESFVYWLQNPAVEAFDRKSGKLLWKKR